MPDNPFTGPERLEFFAPLGRDMRMGALAAAGGTDHSRVEEALAHGRTDEALRLIDMLVADHRDLVSILGEWSLQLPRALVTLVGPEKAHRAIEEVHTEFMVHAASIGISTDAVEGVSVVTQMIAPRPSLAGEAGPDRTGSLGVDLAWIAPAIAGMHRRQQTIMTAIANADLGTSREAFARYVDYTRAVHDACVQFINTFGAFMLRANGQALVEELIRRSFASSSFFEPLWSVGQLPPKDIAAFLAAHIRSHFSGENRGGGVEVIEDEEKYRLVFDACGSGGAMRRRLAAVGLPKGILPSATPATWMRKGEVPAYCAHCAFNELESIRRYGFPKLVTEFNPDPARPCGWTIYKTADRIPEHYYTRLGLTKSGSK